jgi:hypothetical protein
MGKSIYHLADGAPVDAGSDVALVQAQGSRYCSGSFVGPVSVGNNVLAILNPVVNSGENWISGGFFVAPESGRYLLSFMAGGSTVVDAFRRRTLITDITNTALAAEEINASIATGTSLFPTVTAVLNVSKDTVLKFGVLIYGGTGDTNTGGRFNIVLLETKIPIIAGQNNLVSGGAFQFDAQGNGYTENYFEAETQVGWYTRADGKKKPVYKKIIVSDNPVNASAWNNTHVSAVGVERVLESSLLSDDGGTYACYMTISNIPGYFVLLCKDSVGSNARVVLKYLKSTDAWT